MARGTYISIITLNVNGLNDVSKRRRLAKWIQQQEDPLYAVYKKPSSDLLLSHVSHVQLCVTL